MNDEVSQTSDLERERIKATMVAVNPALYKAIYKDEETVPDEEIDWLTPRSQEEMDLIVAQLEGPHIGSESYPVR